MEDVHVAFGPKTWGCSDPDMSLVGVFDGHGGRDIADYLEESFAETLALELSHEDKSDVPTRIERAFLLTDIRSRMAGIMTSGATVAMCLVKKQLESTNCTIYSANCGDARAVLSRTGNHCKRLSHDHRADDPKEIARIEAAGGFVLKNRVLGILAVARSIGDHGMKEYVIGKPYISTTMIELEASDDNSKEGFIIIACDGLWDVMEDQEAVDLVRNICHLPIEYEVDSLNGENIRVDHREKVAQTLADEALKRGSTDNVTAIVAWL